jgi:hypothetical protein
MNPRLALWSLTSALAGFLFGFDTVVISGAEKTIQALWGLSARAARCRHERGALGHGGGLAAGRLAHGSIRPEADPDLDRRALLVSALWSGLAAGTLSLHDRALHRGCGRRHFDGGRAAVHLRNRAAPLPGPPGGMFQFNIVLGILVAFVSNALIGGTGERLALDAGRRGHPRPGLHGAVRHASGEPALADRARDATRAAEAVLRRIEPGAVTRTSRCESRRFAIGRARTGQCRRLLERAAAEADPARVPDRVLQPALGHQRGAVLRTRASSS